MLRVEFTVEPFVEGQPGRHVLAAVEAVRELGPDVDFGPFASSFRAADDVAARALTALVTAAYANGASHVNLQVERVEP